MALELKITGMDCADCAMTLENAINRLTGVERCSVQFTTGKMQINGSPDVGEVQARIEALGYGVADPADENSPPLIPAEGWRGFLYFMLEGRESRLAILGVAGLLLLLMLHLIQTPLIAVRLLELVIIGGVGYPILRRGIWQFWYAREITINLLMSVATVGAVLIGEWDEAATVIVLFAIGEALESYSADRVRGAIQSLMTLSPQTALVRRPCMDCKEHLGQEGYTGGPCPWCAEHEQEIPVDQVKLGEVAIILPGSRIPLDGAVIGGASAVDQAPITGESLPIDKKVGDHVYAGSINGLGTLHVSITHLAQDSTLARIIRLVEQAQAEKSSVERFVNRFARSYTPAVSVLALLIAVIPPLILGAALEDWVYRALALLVIACPCALVISTPVTVVSGMVSAAQQGILIKGGKYLEALGRVKAIAFDKTGTLTQGKPRLIEIKALQCEGSPDCAACQQVLALAAAVERHSEHPLAVAVVRAARGKKLIDRYPTAHAVTAMAGLGVQGQVEGAAVTVGSYRLFKEIYLLPADLKNLVAAREAQGQTVILVAQGQQVLGYLTAADTPRPSAKSALDALPDIHKVMLTGDNTAAAQAIAGQVGIDEIQAELLPQDKLKAVQTLIEKYGTIAMIGDGVNDAPAIAAASIGITLGGAATDQALETADVVLMQAELSQLPAAIRISQRAEQIIRQNIGLSLFTKGLFMLLTLPGWATLWMAVFADMGISLLVTFNGLRLLRKSEP